MVIYTSSSMRGATMAYTIRCTFTIRWSRSLLGVRQVREVRRGPRVAPFGRALEELRGLRLVFSCAGAAREGRGEVVEGVGVAAARGEAQVPVRKSNFRWLAIVSASG